MRNWLFFALLGGVGCGGDGGGEPIMGSISLQYGSAAPDLKVGAVVQDAGSDTKMIVQVGTDNVDCDTNLEKLDSASDFPKGSFVFFTTAMAPGATSGFVSVMKSTSNSVSIHSASGMVTITAIEPRVTGSLTFTTTDEEIGTISVGGDFDIIRCF